MVRIEDFVVLILQLPSILSQPTFVSGPLNSDTIAWPDVKCYTLSWTYVLGTATLKSLDWTYDDGTKYVAGYSSSSVFYVTSAFEGRVTDVSTDLNVDASIEICGLQPNESSKYNVDVFYNTGTKIYNGNVSTELDVFNAEGFQGDSTDIYLNGQHIPDNNINITRGETFGNLTIIFLNESSSLSYVDITYINRHAGLYVGDNNRWEIHITDTADPEYEMMNLLYAYNLYTFTPITVNVNVEATQDTFLHTEGYVSVGCCCACLVAVVIVVAVLACKDKLKKIDLWICLGVCGGIIVIFMFVTGFTASGDTDYLIRGLCICGACLVGVVIVVVVAYFVYDWDKCQRSSGSLDGKDKGSSHSLGKSNGSHVVTPPANMKPLHANAPELVGAHGGGGQP